MKPPLRPRLVPARFAGNAESSGKAQRGPWGPREKRALLAALREKARRGKAEEPLLAGLRENLPRRSEEELQLLLVRLKGRAAREALSSKFRNFLRFQRGIRAPIQLWQNLAETLSGSLGVPSSAAFSQVLTVAATEPLTLNHSRPASNSGFPQNPQNPGIPQDVCSSQNSGISQNLGNFQVDFGKIYEFLARLGAGGEGQQLSPADSAVVLSLLGSLAAELGALGALGALQRHLRATWGALTAPGVPKIH